ncbi:hypothetical protein DIPPA_17764 [Diplonema papillatum]|nr:hypothetical protein DIPPA_17764 [Diplonema papillatum]
MRWLFFLLSVTAFAKRRSIRRQVHRLKFGLKEWRARQDLAALHRIAACMGWDHLYHNCITARVPGEDAVLVAGCGHSFAEVTASNLVKVDMEGNVVDPSTGPQKAVNVAMLSVHMAVYADRPDLQCIVFHNQSDHVAVAAAAEPYQFMPLTEAMALVSFLVAPAPQPYEGLIVSPQQRKRVASAFGNKHKIVFLQNHGVLVGGASIAEAFWNAWTLDAGCKQQTKLLATAGGDTRKLSRISDAVIQSVHNDVAAAREAVANIGKLEFEARKRLLSADSFLD